MEAVIIFFVVFKMLNFYFSAGLSSSIRTINQFLGKIRVGYHHWRRWEKEYFARLDRIPFEIKKKTLGFPRDEMRGKLAIGITANYVNRRTPAEERVPEIRQEDKTIGSEIIFHFSGVAYIFNQAFFKELLLTTGVDLENIVYYKVQHQKTYS